MAQLRVIEKALAEDCTALIQSALDDVAESGGGEVVLSPGRYLTSAPLQIRSGTVLRGVMGAEILPQAPNNASLQVMGDNISLRDLTITGVATHRLSNDPAHAVTVYDSSYVLIERVRVSNSAGAGMLLRNSRYFKIASCTAERTFADGFHVTSGCEYGELTGNFAIETGDDCYAMVAYEKDRALVQHITVANNMGRGGKARGVAVLGGHYISITGNMFSDLDGSGLYFCQEHSYNTYAPRFITATGNVIKNVCQRIRNAGIYIKGNEGTKSLKDGSEVTNAAEYIVLTGNLLDGSGAGGIYISENVSNVGGTGNIIRNTQNAPVKMEAPQPGLQVEVG